MMRSSGVFVLVVGAVLLSVVFIFSGGCTGEKGDTGPAGPEGPQGEAGTTQCFGCHADTTTIITATGSQWDHSMHAEVPNSWAATYIPFVCARCHSGNGFVESLGKDDYGVTPIDCFSCHAPHTNGDFQLRTQAAVTLASGSTFDKGTGNICANCHQARSTLEDYAVEGGIHLEEHIGPHYSCQSDMLRGVGGYDFEKGTSYKSELHYTLSTNACVDCHMSSPYGNFLGGHSFAMSMGEDHLVSACAACHDDEEFVETFDDRLADEDYDGDTEIEGLQSEIEGLLEELEGELIALGYIDEEHNGLEDTVSMDMGGVVFNFLFVYEDGSHGVHNYDYALELLESSLAEVKKAKEGRDRVARSD
jgi:hypothetical protein